MKMEIIILDLNMMFKKIYYKPVYLMIINMKFHKEENTFYSCIEKNEKKVVFIDIITNRRRFEIEFGIESIGFKIFGNA